MNKFSSKIFFRIFSILTMGHFFLPIVFENLFFPLDRKYFYLLGWIAALLVFYPKCFINKRFFYIYFFAAWYFLFIILGIYDVDLVWIKSELEALFFASIMLQYFLISKDFKWLRILVITSFCFILITISTTLVGLQSYPKAARELSGSLALKGEFGLISFYRSLGIRGYDFFYGLAFAVPVIVAFVKAKEINKKKRLIYLLFALFSVYSILQAQFTTAFLFAVIGAIMAFWTNEKIKTALFRIIPILFIVIIFPKDIAADAINSFARLLDESLIQKRLMDLGVTLRYGIGEAGTHIDFRYNRIPFLIQSFFERPFFGGGISLGHNWWLDRLSLFGVSGVIPWILILWSQTKCNLKLFCEKSKIFYLIPMLLFVSMGFLKNMGQQQVMIFLFFLIPSLLIAKEYMIVNEKTLSK